MKKYIILPKKIFLRFFHLFALISCIQLPPCLPLFKFELKYYNPEIHSPTVNALDAA